MSTDYQSTHDPTACPLCGQPNDCRLCSAGLYKDECWCARMEIPPGLIKRVPPELVNKACICRACVANYRASTKSLEFTHTPGPEDYYYDKQGLMVFTVAYHLRRGYCCKNNCRHCPF
jgi:hypothetical protein